MANNPLIANDENGYFMDSIGSTNDIAKDLMNGAESFFQIAGLLVKAGTTTIDTILSGNAISDFETIVNSFYRSTKKYSDVHFDTLSKRYSKYLNSLSSMSQQYDSCLNYIQTDNLTPYDIRSIMSLIYYSAFNSLEIVHKSAANVCKEVERNEHAKLIGSTMDPKSIAELSNSEKYLRNIYHNCDTVKRIYKDINFMSQKTENEDKWFDQLKFTFARMVKCANLGPMYFMIDYPLQDIADILQFMLVAIFKSLFGNDVYLNFSANRTVSVKPIDTSISTQFKLIEMVVFFAYVVERLSAAFEYRENYHPERGKAIIAQLNNTKDLALGVIEKALTIKNVKDVINFVYGIFAHDPAIGKTKLEKFNLDEWPFTQTIGYIQADLVQPITESKINTIVERVKDIRGKDIYNEYRTDITEFISGRFVYDVLDKMIKWVKPMKPEDSTGIVFSKLWEDSDNWKKLWHDAINVTGHYTVLGDASHFGLIMTLTGNPIFTNRMGSSAANQMKSILMTNILNAHITEDTNLNWNANTINLLNMYISYIASIFSADLTIRDERILCDTNITDLFNLCNRLNYRNYRSPQFKYRKDQIEPPKYQKEYHPKKLLDAMKDAALKGGIYSDKLGETEILVRYIGDALLNNAINAEYAILALMNLADRNNRTDPFTKTMRYILGRVGGLDGDFYKKFEKPEIMEFSHIFEPEPESNLKGRVSDLEKNLEVYVFIAILQRMLINIEFNNQFVNQYHDCLNINNLNPNVGRINWNPDVGDIEYGSWSLISIEENVYIRDIKNAMTIFDQTFNGSRKDDDWFEQHKHLIIGNDDKSVNNDESIAQTVE